MLRQLRINPLINSACLSLLLISSVSQAQTKTFKNSYLTVELPAHWACEQGENDYVCTPLDATQARDAMIVISAKEAGPEDNFSSYQAYLSRPRLLQSEKGVPVPSKVIHAKARVIEGQQWIEGLHFASEIEGFFTLYLATVKQGLAILVSLSAEKEKAAKFNEDFSRVIRSIRITASNELLSAIETRQSDQAAQPIGIPQNIDVSDEENPEQKASFKNQVMMIGLVVVGLILLYFIVSAFYPRKKKRKPNK